MQKAIIAEPAPDQGGKKARPLRAPWWLRDKDLKILSESFSMPEVWVLAGSRGHIQSGCGVAEVSFMKRLYRGWAGLRNHQG